MSEFVLVHARENPLKGREIGLMLNEIQLEELNIFGIFVKRH